MIRNTSIFVATFTLGALLALAARAAMHDPHAGQDVHLGDDVANAPMVHNALVPATQSAASASTDSSHQKGAEKTPDHSGHHDKAKPAPESEVSDADENDGKPVNTICAICGMDVDPNLPTATYKGKTIGFGCRMCPPKFKKNPDKYGPYYIRNELAP